MTSRARTPLWLQLTAMFGVGVLVGAFSAVQIAPRITTMSVGQTDAGPLTSVPSEGFTPVAIPTGTGSEGAVPDLTTGPSGVFTTPSEALGLECSREGNGGNPGHAKGVSQDKIKLATTTVQSGRGASFLGEVKYAMEAVKNKVNAEGGICGRLLDIKYVDDGWDAARGQLYIRNFINEDVFAIPVGPSSEGLNRAIESGDIAKAGIPVVGADGMVISQYGDPWVWPVAVATVSTARIMARNAYRKGARNFSIVFDRDYKFGQEAANAYNAEVKRLTKKDVAGYNSDFACRQSFCGIQQGAASYATEIQQFEKGDFLAMFLEPSTALTWMNGANSPKPKDVQYGIGAAQPMFTRDFANNCRQACQGMWIWRAYRPPIDPYDREAAVRTFVTDLRLAKSNADEFNAFTEGGYVGMLLLVEALKRVGPFLTREALAAQLNALTLQTGLTMQPTLDWAPDFRFANTTMRAFEIQYVNTFNGWKATDIERDKTPQHGMS